MGGFAVRHRPLPRPTYDVDFALAAEEADLRRLLRLFEEAGFTVADPFRSGFTETLGGMRKLALGLFDSGSVWNVDLFLATTPLVRSAFERRVPTSIEGRSWSVVSAEDLLLFKLLAWRKKDQADIEDLLLVCGPLDHAYLRRWAGSLGVTERLEAVLREAERS